MALRFSVAAILVGAAAAQTTTSNYWTVTERYMRSTYTYYYTSRLGGVETDTEPSFRTIKPTVTPTVAAVSTYTDSSYDYDDVSYVTLLYPNGAVAESDLMPDRHTQTGFTTTTSSHTTYLDFYMPVTVTAPASCPTPWTVTSTASIYAPDAVTDQLKPTSTITRASTDIYGSVYNYQTWFLTPGAGPYYTSDDSYYLDYVKYCSKPPVNYKLAAISSSTCTAGSTSSSCTNSGNSNSNSNDNNNYYGGDYCFSYNSWGCGQAWATYVIVLASVIPGLFLLGFVESYFWFRRLMLGKGCLRFGTICWVCISLWILCFTRTQSSRSKEDQVLLRENWKKMGAGAAFKNWWKFGFRHRYPEELLGKYSRQTVGIVPPSQPMVQGNNTAMLYNNAAMTVGAAPFNGFSVPGASQSGVYYGPRPVGWLPGPTGGFVPPTGFLQAPINGQPAIYYGPQPQGWTPETTGRGGFVPSLGYVYPINTGVMPPQHTGYYGNEVPMAKGGSVESTPPGSAMGYPGQAEGVVGGPGQQQRGLGHGAIGQQHTVSPLATPEQAHVAPNTTTTAATAPQIPPINVSEAPGSEVPKPPTSGPPPPPAAK